MGCFVGSILFWLLAWAVCDFWQCFIGNNFFIREEEYTQFGYFPDSDKDGCLNNEDTHEYDGL